MEAVKHGAGRETAHEAIKEQAVAVARDLRSGKIAHNDLIQRLAKDSRIGLSEEQLQAILDRADELTGSAAAQVDDFVQRTEVWRSRFPKEAEYTPGAIL